MVPEAELERTERGVRATSDGWFVVNVRDAPWFDLKGRGFQAGLERRDGFDQLGISFYVLPPGEPMSMYHWENDQEDFLVLVGEATLVIEGQERPLRRWDLVHCPPRTAHTIVGAGDRPCVLFAVGARENHTYRDQEGVMHGKEDGGAYAVAEAAIRLGAGVEEQTADPAVAYARFPDHEPTPYQGWLD